MWTDDQMRMVSAALADAFLVGDWTGDDLLDRARRSLGLRTRWLPSVVEDVLATYGTAPRDRHAELTSIIELSLGRRHAAGRLPRHAPLVRKWTISRPEHGATRFDVPAIATRQELADYLGVGISDLGWLADPKGLERSAAVEGMRNYHYRWIPRAHGVPRLIEAPKPWLAKLQRRVLHGILDRVPPHQTAHGFRLGHSPLTHARRHVGQRAVLGFDLEDFFATVEAGRVFGIFRTIGYPEPVAFQLTALCTNHTAAAVRSSCPRPAGAVAVDRRARMLQRLAHAHLPQGAPTSPALANLAAYRLDCRLDGLASSLGATYTRYADDIAVSGDGRLLMPGGAIARTVRDIAADEGHQLNDRKTRVATRAARQLVTGIVVNQHPNVPRREVDRLRAELHDAARNGPDRSNRRGVPDYRAHLLGRIAWVGAVNPGRGARLRDSFDAISWRD
ncbi:MAG: Retron-type RNA-directed polymerase [Thermoleophilia bacterium]|nr:Retron-type RNA-directed polymerase [Thermoleophilia bacterium]